MIAECLTREGELKKPIVFDRLPLPGLKITEEVFGADHVFEIQNVIVDTIYLKPLPETLWDSMWNEDTKTHWQSVPPQQEHCA